MKTEVEINGEKVEIEVENLTEEQADDMHIHIFGKQKTKKQTLNKIKRILPILAFMAFFLVGFLVDNGWKWSWTILVGSFFIEYLLKIKNNNSKRVICDIVTMLIICVTIFVGFYFHIWSWCWVFFLLIPVVRIIME